MEHPIPKDYHTVLLRHYGIDAIEIKQTQGGWASLAYIVKSAEGISLFLKVYEKKRASTPKWTMMVDVYIPIVVWLGKKILKDRIVEPILTSDGKSKCEDENYIYILFEYIDGLTIGENQLTNQQVHNLSEIISDFHISAEQIPYPTSVIKEDFQMDFADQLASFLETEVKDAELESILIGHFETLKLRLKQLTALVSVLKSKDLPFVLCHTDLHNWNMMQTEKQLVLLDWEGLKMAPAEADLFGLVEEPYFEQVMVSYQKVHKGYTVDEDALNFYIIRRKIEDIWECIEQLLFDQPDDQEKREIIGNLEKELSDL
ncbi:phosphotransferase [Pedobacter caeni]|uniref:Phosphotransferase enzyme family protein n=1 Tax=Pedobacter caeni TaxID=288992 RepID=A0A1M5BIF7_9SPHI|nr:aminoglycoside phosphotransferase family protein [Pedobacter caeni]SHF42189.1 Phosphotransferase enzyme family protein [Pedobacter caeni]